MSESPELQNVPLQPVLICDLDGCLVANPADSFAQGTISDPNYWTEHWKNWHAATPNQELVDVVRALMRSGYKLVVLTARPTNFREETMRYLYRVFGVGASRISLIMMDTGGKIVPSAAWKRATISKMIELGYDVKLMIEDYKPNADAIRGLVPVLLYERKK